MIKAHEIVMSLGVFVTACSAPEAKRVDVTEANTLGVVALEIERDAGNFELRGLTASGDEVARVEKRVGALAELNGGTELLVAAADHQDRFVTPGVQRIDLPRLSDPGTRAFVELAAVRSALADEGNVFVASAGPERDESAYYTYNCPASWLLAQTSEQCCASDIYDYFGNLAGQQTVHVNPTYLSRNANTLVFRTKNIYGGGCKASDGYSACSGSSCYYGPNGFSMPLIQTGYPYWFTYSYVNYGQTYCDGGGSSYPVSPSFADVTGYFPAGYGCCIDGSGPCANATACASCGGGGASGRGSWDY